MVDAIDSKSILGCQGAGSSPVIGKLVLLDFDGLLVDTESLHHLAYQEALLNWGCPLDINFNSYIGLAHHFSGTGLKDYVYNTYPSLTGKWKEIRQDKIAIYARLSELGVSLMPCVKEFITLLNNKNIPCAVVTNSLKTDVERIIAHHPILQTIPHYITRESYEKPKPEPDGYLTALKLYPHIKPDEALGLEDTLKGIEAIKKAGIRPLLVCHPNHPQLAHAKDIKTISTLCTLCEN